MSTSSADVNVAAIRGLYDRLFSGKLSGTSLDDVFDVLTNTYCRVSPPPNMGILAGSHYGGICRMPDNSTRPRALAPYLKCW